MNATHRSPTRMAAFGFALLMRRAAFFAHIENVMQDVRLLPRGCPEVI
jgi:hypothetical protein